MHFALAFTAIAMAIATPINAACNPPTTSYCTLPKLFTMNVLVNTHSYNITLLPGRVDSNTYNKPLITSSTVNPPLKFNLTNSILYQSGYPANARYVPPPPHPTTDQEMLFGGNPTIPPNEVGFAAKYDCDAAGKQILTLRQQQGFIVGGENEGAELYIQPNGYAGCKFYP